MNWSDLWPWMTKLQHKKEMVQIMQESYEREKKATEQWKELLKLNKDLYKALINDLNAEIEKLKQ